jgi:hypothetical protein
MNCRVLYSVSKLSAGENENGIRSSYAQKRLHIFPKLYFGQRRQARVLLEPSNEGTLQQSGPFDYAICQHCPEFVWISGEGLPGWTVC